MQWHKISAQIATSLNQPFNAQTPQPISGGSINAAYLLEDRGKRFFVKLNSPHRLAMFEAEHQALLAIKSSNTLQVPTPLCCGIADAHAFIAMEYLEFSSSNTAHQQARLGEQLAEMHRVSANSFGWERSNTIGTTVQYNEWRNSWPDFWCDQRIKPQLKLLAERGYQGAIQSLGERLLNALPTLLEGHHPQPAMLHGDLWSGNYAFNRQGEPLVFDPALYYGDRETDLAMTELFGGFSPLFYDAYQKAYPLDEGYPQRKKLYNLYHILNHGNLFGGSYITQAERLMADFL